MNNINEKIARLKFALIHYPYHDSVSRALDVNDLIRTLKYKYSVYQPQQEKLARNKNLDKDGYLDLTKKTEFIDLTKGCGKALSNPFFAHYKCGDTSGKLCDDCESKSNKQKGGPTQ